MASYPPANELGKQLHCVGHKPYKVHVVNSVMAKQTKFTLLEKQGGWAHFDMLHLREALATAVRGHPEHPNHLVLDGHFTDEELRAALPKEYAAQTVVGAHRLPKEFAAQIAARA